MAHEDEHTARADAGGPGGGRSAAGGGDAGSGPGPTWRRSLDEARDEAAGEGALVYVDLFDPG